MHLGIIGDGFSAAEVARLNAMKLSAGDTLTILGISASKTYTPGMLGRGLAYGYPKKHPKRRIEYLLNSPANMMGEEFNLWVRGNIQIIIEEMQTCAENGNLRAAEWLEYNAAAINEGRTGDLFLPRVIYGDFHSQRVEKALSDAEKRGVIINRLNETVTAVNHISLDNSFVIETHEKQPFIKTDFVFVTVGAPTPHRFSNLTADDGSFNQLYGLEDAIVEKIKQSPDKPALIIGGNAAMLDALRMIKAHKDLQDQKIIVVTPSGALPPASYIDTEKRHYKPKIASTKKRYKTARAFLDDIERERDLGLSEGYSIIAIRSALEKICAFIPDMLPPEEATSPLINKIDVILRRATPDAIDEVKHLVQSGVLEIKKGKVADIEKAPSGEHLEVKINETQKIEVSLAINTTGACSMANALEKNDTCSAMALMRDLVIKDVISLNTQTGQIEVGDAGETNVPGLHLISPAVGHKGGVTPPFAQYDVIQLAQSAENAALQNHKIEKDRDVAEGFIAFEDDHENTSGEVTTQ